jgi:hypothetical protein
MESIANSQISDMLEFRHERQIGLEPIAPIVIVKEFGQVLESRQCREIRNLAPVHDQASKLAPLGEKIKRFGFNLDECQHALVAMLVEHCQVAFG